MYGELIERVVGRVGGERRNLVAVLQGVQDELNYLPAEVLQGVARRLGMSEADVTGVATFYNQFRLQPAGRRFIRVCIGTACHVKGAERTYDAFLRALKVPEGYDTDPSGEFTVEKVACLGCCMLAVAVQIDRTIYGNVTAATVGAVLRDAAEIECEAGEGDGGGSEGSGVVVRICACSSCSAAGADGVLRQIRQKARELHLPVVVREVGCTGGSFHAPLMEVVLEDGTRFRYGRVKARDVEEILLRHVQPARGGARLMARLRAWTEMVFVSEGEEPPLRFPLSVRDEGEGCYWECQQRVATAGAGELPPLDYEEYCRSGGFEALAKVRGMEPLAVVEEVRLAGLRGRGGGGFVTGVKWGAVVEGVRRSGRAAVGDCNADEGDPGAFMDRMLLESYPFRVVEGMLIAAHAVGAAEGILYIRHEYPLAVERVREALAVVEREGWLGEPAVRLRVVEGAGAFVCGEESALLASLEGRRGVPRARPPYPAESGLEGVPTLVNNVETLALVPWIMRYGAERFREVGSVGSPGTKAFALAGKIERGGLIEVEMGVALREVVERIGGGVGEGHELKAVQVGGPSGGCVPAELADTGVDYEALVAAGGMMGSGGLVVLDESDCMVEIARYFLAFTQAESCGKCTACRIGTRRMLEVLERLCGGEGRAGDLELLEELGQVVQAGSLCGLGRSAPNPVISTMRHFRSEYEAHIRGECPARGCRALIEYHVTKRCIGCTLCAQHCPVEAISFDPLQRAEIRVDECTKCDLCRQVCPEKAIEKWSIKRDTESHDKNKR